MPAGGIVNVTPVAPGQYKADFGNGESALLTGGPGEDAFNRFQAANSLGARGAVAGPGAGAPPGESEGVRGLLGNALRAGEALVNPAGAVSRAAGDVAQRFTSPDQPAPPPAAAPAASPAPTEAPPAQPAPAGPVAPVAAQPAQAATPQQTGPVPLGHTMKAVDPATGKEFEGDAFRMPDGSVKIVRQGMAGTPGGLTDAGKSRMEKYVASQTRAAEKMAEAAEYRQIGTDLAIQDAEAYRAHLEEQKVQTQLIMQEQADEQRAVEERVNSYRSSYDKAAQEFQAARVDPDRYMKSKGGGGRALTGLAAALGAFGAGMARTPNFAMDFINNRIADDMRSQEAEINVKGRAADNLLGRLTREMGDLQLAKKSFRQLQLQEAGYEAELVANGTKSQQIANAARQVAAETAAAGAIAGDEKDAAFYEKTMKEKLYYRPGSAGRAGGIFSPTQESYQSGRSSGIAVEDLKLRQQKQDAEAAGAPKPVAEERTGKVSALGDSLSAAVNIRKELESRNVVGDVVDDPTTGAYDRATNIKSNEALSQNTEALAKGLQAAYGKSDRDAEDALKRAEGGGSGNARYSAAVKAQNKVLRDIKAELITLPPEQQAQLISTLPPEAQALLKRKK